jgi:hypothetical protein
VKYDIFISYSHKDIAAAAALERRLRAYGWSVWWDPELRAGEHFDREVEDAINRSSYVIVLWSPAAIASDWVRAEAVYALHDRKLISASIVPGLRLPLRFANVHTVSLSDLSHIQLERIIGRPRRAGRGPAPSDERTPPHHALIPTDPSAVAANAPARTVTRRLTAADAAADVVRSLREVLMKRDSIVGAGSQTTPEILAYRDSVDVPLVRDMVLLFLEEIASHTQYKAQWPAGLAILELVGDQFPAELSYQTEDGKKRNLEFLRSLKPREGLDLNMVLSAVRQIEYDRWV